MEVRELGSEDGAQLMLLVESIRLTLETLYDILRNEKKREDLQKLEDTFFIDVIGYVREKRNLLESKEHSSDIFAAGEREKLEYELRSIRRILKEIYEKREKKIIEIALNRSRTGSDIIDTSAMLREEKEFYREILHNLDLYRKGVLLKMFDGELPALVQRTASQNAETHFGATEAAREARTRPGVPAPKILSPSSLSPAQPHETMLASDGKTKIRFIRPTPSFVWKDLKKYGPYDPGEETEIYPEVADLLVRKGRAEKMT